MKRAQSIGAWYYRLLAGLAGGTAVYKIAEYLYKWFYE